MFPVPVILAQGPAFDTGISSLVLSAGLVVKSVLLLLLLFSVVSWAIIFYKLWVYRKAKQATEAFIPLFRKGSRLDFIYTAASGMTESPACRVFRAAFAEMTQSKRDEGGDWGPEKGFPTTLPVLDNVDRALKRAALTETARLEWALSFLATTGSTTPFIGLFGTVWGIMDSFRNIGASGGAASLAIVAPGISEALVATAAGLAAAIPAVIFYNLFTHRVGLFTTEMEALSAEVLNIVGRNAAERVTASTENRI